MKLVVVIVTSLFVLLSGNTFADTLNVVPIVSKFDNRFVQQVVANEESTEEEEKEKEKDRRK